MRALFAAGVITLGAACAQQAPRAFEVASVKISDSPSMAMGGNVGFRRGAMAVRNVTLKKLIELAYGVEECRVTGGPDWISTERYNVDAKPSVPVANDEARLMLQSLLAQR